MPLVTFEAVNPALTCVLDSMATRQWHTEGGGVWGVQTPPSKILKALQDRAKLKPIVKTVRNC